MKMPSTIYHHQIPLNDRNGSLTHVWEMNDIHPFDELIVSWNALRPKSGTYSLSIAVKTTVWSEWFPYATWGQNSQSGGHADCSQTPLKIYQDTLELLNGNRAKGFRIRVEALNGANLNDFFCLHVFAGQGIWCQACNLQFVQEAQITNQKPDPNFHGHRSIELDVPLISQMALPHPRNLHMCSPTSTTAVVRYLLKNSHAQPIQFALQARDEAFDIFGNWILNIAEASAVLDPDWHCWVQRLIDFNDIYKQLNAKIPVIVSVKGPLNGSAQSYNQGHLIVVKGYDSKNKKVLCMDPAFPTDAETNVSYGLNDFLEAWSRRGNIAYMFTKNSHSTI